MLTLFVYVLPVNAQERIQCRYDTLQIEQQWKIHLTGKKDTSYIKVCIPNNDVVPAYDLNYSDLVIICDDGAIIRLLTTPYFSLSIDHELESVYEDTIKECFGYGFFRKLQWEYINTHALGLPPDSSLYPPQPIVLEGISKKGLCWKVIRMEYISISYENVAPERKFMYDFILNEYKFLKKHEVVHYRRLPFYK